MPNRLTLIVSILAALPGLQAAAPQPWRTHPINREFLSRNDSVGAGSAGRWPAVFGGPPNTSFHKLARTLRSAEKDGERSRRRAGDDRRRAAGAPHSTQSFRLSAHSLDEADVNGDGDLDLVGNVEEHSRDLGGREKEAWFAVVWFANPAR